MKKENLPRIEHIEVQVDKLIAQVHNRKVHQGKILAPTIAKYISLYAKIETLLSECYAAFHDEESVHDHIPDKTKEVEEKHTPKNVCTSKDKRTKSTNHKDIRIQDSDKRLKTTYCLEYGRTLYNMCYKYDSKADSSNKWVFKISEYECFDELIRLIQAWYQGRLADPTIPKKIYSLKQVNQAIYAFVIMFGYYHELEYVHGQDNALQEFTDEVYDWISELQTSEYAATHFFHPKAILDCIINPDPSMFTVTALILWEIFVKKGFGKFCNKYYNYTDAPKVDDVDKLCKKYNPEVLDTYYNIDEDYSYEAYQIY